MREKYESLSLATLKDLAKARGLKGVSALRKPELIERMLHEDELEGETKKQETVREKPQQSEVEGNGERIPQYNKTLERTQYHAPARIPLSFPFPQQVPGQSVSGSLLEDRKVYRLHAPYHRSALHGQMLLYSEPS